MRKVLKTKAGRVRLVIKGSKRKELKVHGRKVGKVTILDPSSLIIRMPPAMGRAEEQAPVISITRDSVRFMLKKYDKTFRELSKR